MIKLADPLGRPVEGSAFVRRTLPLFWIVRGIDSGEEDEEPWAEVEEKNEETNADGGLKREVEEEWNGVSEQAIENSSDDSKWNSYWKGIEKAHK